MALVSDAVRAALAASGVERERIDAVLTHRPPAGDNFLLFSQKLVAELKIVPTSTTSIMNHGAGMLSAIKYGALLLEAGLADCVLCPSGDAVSVWVEDVVAMNANIEADAHFEAPYDPITPALYAQIGQRFVHERGLTDTDLALVAVAMRERALEHPEAEMRNKGPLTVEQVIASPMIASPSRLLHCAPWYRGGRAGAVVLMRADDAPAGPRTYLRAVGEAVTHEHISGRMGLNPVGPWEERPNLTASGARIAARQALSFSGLIIDDIDVAETAVPFAFLIPLMLEDLGICEPGGSREFIRGGGLGPAEPLAFNTNGGMLSFGQAALNCAMDQLIEALQQLDRTALGRCPATPPRTALVHAHGGVIAANTVAVLERVS